MCQVPLATMRLLSLLLLAGLFAACGDSRQAPQSRAVIDAERVVAFYLPWLLNDPALTSDKLFRPSATLSPRGVASQKLGEKQAQASSRFQEQFIAVLQAIGRQEFRGLSLTATGRSFGGPGYGNN